MISASVDSSSLLLASVATVSGVKFSLPGVSINRFFLDVEGVHLVKMGARVESSGGLFFGLDLVGLEVVLNDLDPLGRPLPLAFPFKVEEVVGAMVGEVLRLYLKCLRGVG